MTREECIRVLLMHISMENLKRTVNQLLRVDANNEGLNLLDVTLETKSDPKFTWFSALAVLCKLKPAMAMTVIELSFIPNNPVEMTKQELVDAIAASSKLTKADAG